MNLPQKLDHIFEYYKFPLALLLIAAVAVGSVEEMAQLCVDLALRASPQSIPCLLLLPVSYASGGSTRDCTR